MPLEATTSRLYVVKGLFAELCHACAKRSPPLVPICDRVASRFSPYVAEDLTNRSQGSPDVLQSVDGLSDKRAFVCSGYRLLQLLEARESDEGR